MKKRRLIIVIVSLLALLLTTPASALAYEPWDVEDPCVVANEDFIAGGGYDDGVMKPKSGKPYMMCLFCPRRNFGISAT